MDQPKPSTTRDETGAAGPRVTVRYWAAARAAAGRTQDSVVGATAADVLARAAEAHPDNSRFAQVLAISSLLLGDEPIRARDLADVKLAEGDVIEVLPPFAGG